MSELKIFLKNCISKENITNTRIGDKKLNIYGGAYSIPDDRYNQFLNSYYEHVFIHGNKEYLTEKQLLDDGPILIDIDLRYNTSITTRQHNEDYIYDCIGLYCDKIKEICDIPIGSDIEIFIMEKKNVNIQEKYTKDGIHIIFGIKLHKALQVILRNKVINGLREMWTDLPLINSYDDVLDEGVTKGFVNWQLYGSRKPSNEPYRLTYHYKWTKQDITDDDDIVKLDVNEFMKKLKKNIMKLSARNRSFPSYNMLDNIKVQYEEAIKSLNEKDKSKNKNKPRYKLKICSSVKKNYNDIENDKALDDMLSDMFDELETTEYKLKETHEYTMALPESYYGPGSFTKWIRVGWALANTSHKLFLTWLKFTSQSNCRETLRGNNNKFDWNCVNELFDMWNNFDIGKNKLSNRSIIYWCKNDARDKYDEIRLNTTDYFIEQSISAAEITEVDLAMVLYSICKDNYVCTNIKNNIWYQYKGHKWHENETGRDLRMIISKKMYKMYFIKIRDLQEKLSTLDSDNDNIQFQKIKKSLKKITEICTNLKRTPWRNNIMRESRDLFYDNLFINKLDQNPYLLCFNNCVVDIKHKLHRAGVPEDYISKSTNIDYIPYNNDKYENTINEIEYFMRQLFPDKNLNRYMWEHLSSSLVGTNNNQTFNIYTGCGANGKSKLVDLMSKSLGEYKGTVPITLITQKRNTIGGTSSEIVQLVGIRYAVMQEPSKTDIINEGIMKEITGGDPIQGRALFKDTITFVPQFNLVVCTNTMLGINSNDDGTWRRIRVCDFESKFVDKPYNNIKLPKEDYPYQFPIDKNIDNKFEEWSPIFMSILVKMAYEMEGNVVDCDKVLSSSNEYREGQDYLSEFIKENIYEEREGFINSKLLQERFKEWWSVNGSGKKPNGKELKDHMNKKYEKANNGWKDILFINYDEDY